MESHIFQARCDVARFDLVRHSRAQQGKDFIFGQDFIWFLENYIFRHGRIWYSNVRYGRVKGKDFLNHLFKARVLGYLIEKKQELEKKKKKKNWLFH